LPPSDGPRSCPFSWSGICLFRDSAVRRWFRSAILWFAFLVAVLATIQTFTSKGKVFWLFATPYTENVMGPILYRNHYAAFIEAVLPIALYLAVRRERQSLLYSGMAAVMYASVVASASRAGTVLATGEIVLVPLLMWALGRGTGRSAAAALLRMCLLFAAFAAIVGLGSVWGRFRTPDPLGIRRELAVSSVHMAASHPWFGTGLGTWPTVYPRYAIVDIGEFANQAHDDWLQWTVEGGFPLASCSPPCSSGPFARHSVPSGASVSSPYSCTPSWTTPSPAPPWAPGRSSSSPCWLSQTPNPKNPDRRRSRDRNAG